MKRAGILLALLVYGLSAAYAATVFTPVSQSGVPLFTAANPGAVLCR